jgi:mono/diheme cytochrome c family protein
LFVNALRIPAPAAAPTPPPEFGARCGADRFTLDAVNSAGVLRTSAWVRPVPDHLLAPNDYAARAEHQGRELFRALCASRHTIDGYLAIQPLVRGRSAEALAGIIDRLPAIDEMMPAFDGTEEQRKALAAYLVSLPKQTPKGGAR